MITARLKDERIIQMHTTKLFNHCNDVNDWDSIRYVLRGSQKKILHGSMTTHHET